MVLSAYTAIAKILISRMQVMAVVKKDNGVDIGLRALKPDDLGTLQAWYSMTDKLGHATGSKSFSEIARDVISPSEPNSFSFMICEKKSNLSIGFTYAHFYDISGKTVFWIKVLLIDPRYQSKGYGTEAVNRLISYAKMKNKAPLSCFVSVSSDNRDGKAFWEKMGFYVDNELDKLLHREGNSGISIYKKLII